jgi:hypothetical protein
VLLVLGQDGRGRLRLWVFSLLPILVLSAVAAVQQVSDAPREGNRSAALKISTKATPREAGTFDYGAAGLTEYLVRQGPPTEVDFPIAAVHDERVSETVHLQPGKLVYTNIGGGPELVHITGARIVGITPTRDDVIEIGRGVRESRRARSGGRGSRWSEVISVSPATGLPVVAGRVLSLVAIAFLVTRFLGLALRRVYLRARPSGS